jgi:hypothetical protein
MDTGIGVLTFNTPLSILSKYHPSQKFKMERNQMRAYAVGVANALIHPNPERNGHLILEQHTDYLIRNF